MHFGLPKIAPYFFLPVLIFSAKSVVHCLGTPQNYSGLAYRGDSIISCVSSTREEQASAHLLDVPQCTVFMLHILTSSALYKVNAMWEMFYFLLAKCYWNYLLKARCCPYNEKRLLFGLNTHSYAENCSSATETSFSNPSGVKWALVAVQVQCCMAR